MLLAALTGLIFLAWCALVSSEGPGTADPGETSLAPASAEALPASTRLVLAGVGTSAQIVLTSLGLAVAGRLTVAAAVPVSLAISAVLLVLALHSRPRRERLSWTLSTDPPRAPHVPPPSLGGAAVL